jgi:hypothetical protein
VNKLDEKIEPRLKSIFSQLQDSSNLGNCAEQYKEEREVVINICGFGQPESTTPLLGIAFLFFFGGYIPPTHSQVNPLKM